MSGYQWGEGWGGRNWEIGLDIYTQWIPCPPWLSGKESACCVVDVGDTGSIPGWERSPGGGSGNPLQYSCQKNPMDRGAQRATVHRIRKTRTRLSDWTHTCKIDSWWEHIVWRRELYLMHCGSLMGETQKGGDVYLQIKRRGRMCMNDSFIRAIQANTTW